MHKPTLYITRLTTGHGTFVGVSLVGTGFATPFLAGGVAHSGTPLVQNQPPHGAPTAP